MNFDLFDFLDWKIPKRMQQSYEKKFAEVHQQYFSFYGFLSRFNEVSNSFDLIRKTIILQGLLAKKQIEDEAQLYSDTELSMPYRMEIIHNRLPFFTHENVNIYIPFFSPSFNKRYDTKVDSLSKHPFSLLKHDFQDMIIDPFETYGLELFKSDFTRLIFLREDETCAAFYHVDFETIFIINNEGSLDHMIPIFDNALKNPEYKDFFKRLLHVIDAYFNYDRDLFIERLCTDGLISKFLYDEIIKLSKHIETKKLKKKLKAFK